MSNDGMVLEWRYSVLYTFGLDAEARKWNTGIVKYYPAERRAVLEGDGGEVIDEKSPTSAGGLCCGGELILNKTMIVIQSDILADGEGACVQTANNQKTIACSVTQTASALVRQHEILWTMEKTKKNRKWNDGWMECRVNDKLAIFYDEAGRVLYRKKYLTSLPQEGEILDTSKFLIEISIPLTEKRVKETIKTENRPQEEETDVSRVGSIAMEQETADTIREYAILYTLDKVRKSKRWKDGLLKWNPRTNQGLFYDEENHQMYRRKILSAELIEGNQISTAQYEFQICEIREHKGPAANKRDNIIDKDPGRIRVLQRKSVKRPSQSGELAAVDLFKKGRSNADLLKLLVKAPACPSNNSPD